MTNEEKLELAQWALMHNKCWLGSGIRDDIAGGKKFGYLAIYSPGPYRSSEVIEESFNTDKWEALKYGINYLTRIEGGYTV